MLIEGSLIFSSNREYQSEKQTLKFVNNYLNTNIYSYFETLGLQISYLYLNVNFFQHQC